MVERAQTFHAELVRRRTVRDFDTRLVSFFGIKEPAFFGI
jgi:hypothetical protein